MIDKKELTLFVLLFVGIYICLETCTQVRYNIKVSNLYIALVGSAILYFILTKLLVVKDNFVYPDVCRGGSYMFQGNDPTAVMCRELEKTEEGRRAIASVNCAPGFVGKPNNAFAYSSNSDSNWKSYSCADDGIL
jgi:hypothetical protein